VPQPRLVHTRGPATAPPGPPPPAASIFYVGPLAKQFVAACVAPLEHEGALGLDEPIARYVPDLPSWGDRVHIRHLIHHTGGFPNVYRPGGGIAPDRVPPSGH